MVQDNILYDILNIKSDASESEIKKAYRKLSMIWHPDKNVDNKEQATKKFQEVSEAYSVLSDPEKKASYDRFGYESLKNPQGGMPDFNPEDIFQQFFGGQGGMFGRGEQRQQEHCVVDKEVSLEELFCEKTITIAYKQKISCKKCNGNGTKDGKKSTCGTCDGSGKQIRIIRQGMMAQQMISHCTTCNGSGEIMNKINICEDCKGKKVQVKEKTFDLPLTKKMSNGNKIIVEGKGNILNTGITNLIIILHEKTHNVFTRDGKDLHINMKLRIFQTLFGFTKSFNHLDGRILALQYNGIKKMDPTFKIKNEGMNGDLYVHITTSIPNLDKLDNNEKVTLKNILIKLNQTENSKEQNLIKRVNPEVILIPSMNISEVDTSKGSKPEETSHHESHGMPGFQMPGFEMPGGQGGAQCAQQ